MSNYRIRDGVVPNGGRVLEGVKETATTISGYVRLSRSKRSLHPKTYLKSELEELPPEAAS